MAAESTVCKSEADQFSNALDGGSCVEACNSGRTVKDCLKRECDEQAQARGGHTIREACNLFQTGANLKCSCDLGCNEIPDGDCQDSIVRFVTKRPIVVCAIAGTQLHAWLVFWRKLSTPPPSMRTHAGLL
jgi:hypothetical protein